MADKSYALEIRTPEKLVFEEQGSSVTAPGVEGNFQILVDHIPFLTILTTGVINIQTMDGDRSLATSGGLFEVLSGRVTALLYTAEWSDEIDVERAEASRNRAKERLTSRGTIDIDEIRAEAALKRALTRLKISSP